MGSGVGARGRCSALSNKCVAVGAVSSDTFEEEVLKVKKDDLAPLVVEEAFRLYCSKCG